MSNNKSSNPDSKTPKEVSGASSPNPIPTVTDPMLVTLTNLIDKGVPYEAVHPILTHVLDNPDEHSQEVIKFCTDYIHSPDATTPDKLEITVTREVDDTPLVGYYGISNELDELIDSKTSITLKQVFDCEEIPQQFKEDLQEQVLEYESENPDSPLIESVYVNALLDFTLFIEPKVQTKKTQHSTDVEAELSRGIDNKDFDEEVSERQEKFCREYLIDLNGTQAAKRAGYSSKNARQIASKMLTQTNIRNCIDGLRAKYNRSTELSVERVRTELMKIAFTNMDELAEWDGGSFTLRDSADLTPEALACVNEIQETIGANGSGSVRIKKESKLKAIELLAKHMNMFTDKVEISGRDGGPVQTEAKQKIDLSNLTNEELAVFGKVMQKQAETEQKELEDD